MNFGGGDAWVEEGVFPAGRTTANTKVAVSGEMVVGSRACWMSRLPCSKLLYNWMIPRRVIIVLGGVDCGGGTGGDLWLDE